MTGMRIGEYFAKGDKFYSNGSLLSKKSMPQKQNKNKIVPMIAESRKYQQALKNNIDFVA